MRPLWLSPPCLTGAGKVRQACLKVQGGSPGPHNVQEVTWSCHIRLAFVRSEWVVRLLPESAPGFSPASWNSYSIGAELVGFARTIDGSFGVCCAL